MLKRAEQYYRKSNITSRVICFILTIKSDKNNIHFEAESTKKWYTNTTN